MVGRFALWVQVPAPVSSRNEKKKDTNTMETAKEGVATEKEQLAAEVYCQIAKTTSAFEFWKK
jgi:hypothetical protein